MPPQFDSAAIPDGVSGEPCAGSRHKLAHPGRKPSLTVLRLASLCGRTAPRRFFREPRPRARASWRHTANALTECLDL